MTVTIVETRAITGDSQDEMDHRADQVREDLAEMISLARAAEPGSHVDLPEQLLAPEG